MENLFSKIKTVATPSWFSTLVCFFMVCPIFGILLPFFGIFIKFF